MIIICLVWLKSGLSQRRSLWRELSWLGRRMSDDEMSLTLRKQIQVELNIRQSYRHKDGTGANLKSAIIGQTTTSIGAEIMRAMEKVERIAPCK